MAVFIVQPSGSGGASSEFFHTGGPLATAAPLAFYAEVTLNGAPGALGSNVWTIDRLPAESGFGGWDSFTLILLPDLSIAARVKSLSGLTVVAAIHPGPIVFGTVARIFARFVTTTSRFVIFDGDVSTEDTAFCSPNPVALDDTMISSGPISAVGSYNCGLNACCSNFVCWAGTIPSEAEAILITTGSDPLTFAPEGIRGYAPFVDVASATDFMAWDGGAVTPTTSLIHNHDAGGDGALADCSNGDDSPNPEPETECGIEDVADEPQLCGVNWPECDLVPSDINVEIVSPSSSPGRSLTSREQIVKAEAGYWRITLVGVKVWSRDEVLLWREIESALNGRNGTCCVPLYEGVLSSTPIAAIAADPYAIGAVRLGIVQTTGAEIRVGMHFSAAERGYRIMRVFGTIAGVISVVIWPPLRDIIAQFEVLDFNTPRVRCRLERDDGMNINLELLRYAKPSVAFVEDV